MALLTGHVHAKVDLEDGPMLPLHLQPESHVPLYIQLRDQLKALVHDGNLRPGDRIPASRELAARLGVHRTTVSNAYAELESEGLIEGHVGRGTFVKANGHTLRVNPPPLLAANGGVRWESLFADERGDDPLGRLMAEEDGQVLSFVTARPAEEFFPVEDLRNCLNTVLRRDASTILQFGPSDGYSPFKAALGDLVHADGIEAKDDNLLVTSGCQQSLDLLGKAFLRPGDAVILENPTYPGAIAAYRSPRVRSLGVAVRMRAEGEGFVGLDLEALEEALMANRVKLIVVIPDFHNPTGTTMPLASRRRLLELAGRHQVPVVEDRVYARLNLRGETLPSLKQLDRQGLVIQIDSFSKVAFPGLRVGWVVAAPVVIERLRVVKQTTDLHTDQLAQAALAEFLRRGMLARHLTHMRKTYALRLEAMEEALEKHMPEAVRWTRPEGGMCLWLELPLGFDASEFLIHLRGRGVLFAPGRYFYVQNPQPNTLRLAFPWLDERRIAKGVAAFGELLRVEMRKRERGTRRAERARMAFV